MSAAPGQLTQLQAAQDEVNADPYVPDSPVFNEPPDTWKFKPDGRGFLCRDYAEAKALALQRPDMGAWPQPAMTLVLCYTEPVEGFPTGEYHAVLAVEAGEETWVLDNRVDAIYRWDRPPYPYRWALRQVAGTDDFLDVSLA